MAIMTEEEANALDELLTKTTPIVNPAIRGITARKGFRMMMVDDFSANYIISRANATGRTTEEIIHSLIDQEMSATTD